jgi:hypothetical protein
MIEATLAAADGAGLPPGTDLEAVSAVDAWARRHAAAVGHAQPRSRLHA